MLNKVYKQGLGLPLQGSDVAVAWDTLYWFLFWLSVFFFILVVGGMIYFAVAYRKKEGRKPKYIVDHHLLEAVWTAIPTVLLLVIFAWGWGVYKKMITPPANAMEIRVIGQQWKWSFQYEDGHVESNKVVDGKTEAARLYVPINTPVKLLMSSQDVLHSFFVPNFRIKQDVVPGMYTSVWFEAKVAGEHQIYCTEYCGLEHSLMLGKVIVLEADQYKLWKAGKAFQISGVKTKSDHVTATQSAANKEAKLANEQLPLPKQGEKIMQAQGCFACHNSNGTAQIGPSHKGIFGKERELANGEKVVADENYIRESITNPQKKVVKGFNPVMPPYVKEQIGEADMNAIIAYIKSLN